MDDLLIDSGNSLAATSHLTSTEPEGRVHGLMLPADVVQDARLTRSEKRQLLASWASDARAVPDMPSLRQLDNAAVVRVEDVLAALQSLDDDAGAERKTAAAWRPADRRPRLRLPARLKSAWRRRHSDGDDEPPPCPAVISWLPRGPLSGGEALNPVMLAA